MIAARDPPAEAGVTRRETLPERRFPYRGRFTTDSLARMLPPLRSVVKKPSRGVFCRLYEGIAQWRRAQCPGRPSGRRVGGRSFPHA